VIESLDQHPADEGLRNPLELIQEDLVFHLICRKVLTKVKAKISFVKVVQVQFCKKINKYNYYLKMLKVARIN